MIKSDNFVDKHRRRPFSYFARRYGRAFSCLTARGGGLPSCNYLVKQLKNFRDGKRKSDTMNEMAKDLKDDQIEALADYFSSKPALTHRVRDKGFAAVGEYLFKKGNRYSGIPACKSCHGEFGQGTDELPRLAGQHKRYVADQLQAFGERARTNDNAIMHTIASKLTEMEIEALALYVSGIKEETKEEQ